MERDDIATIMPVDGTQQRYHPLRVVNAPSISALLAHVDDARLLGREADGLTEPGLSLLLDRARTIRTNGVLTDASALDVQRLSSTQPPPSAAFDAWAKGAVRYVHLGAHAFPSPFFRAGIEGAYLIMEGIRDEAVHLRATMIVSPEFALVGGGADGLFDEDILSIAESLRHLSIRAVLQPSGVGIGTAWDGQEIADWMPSLAAPLIAAINAIALDMAGDAVIHGLPDSIIDDALENADEAAFAAANGAVLVRFLGRIPSDAFKDYAESFPTGKHPSQPSSSTKRDVTALLLRSAKANHPGASEHYARAAKQLLDAALRTGGAAEIPRDLQDAMNAAIAERMKASQEDYITRFILEDR